MFAPAPFLLTSSGCGRHYCAVNDAALPPADPSPADAPSVYAKFDTELHVRPDDIDMYQHVHSSRYMDYVLAARFDQMERCYQMPMAEFQKRGYGWFMAATQMNFKRPLGLGDRFVVRTWIEKFTLIGVKVQFQILRQPDQQLSCDGWFDYVMISIETARAVRLPADIRAKYEI
ncbi:MAG: acyl-CoA thioesterase [Lacunisphaera sp.]|nr:acyl-CoA thioesterase [Lacunisphaera sp.]